VVTARRVKYMAERRHIINNLHHGRSTSARRIAADAVFNNLNKRSQFPVPLSMSAAAERRQHGAGATSNGGQVNNLNYSDEPAYRIRWEINNSVSVNANRRLLIFSIYCFHNVCTFWRIYKKVVKITREITVVREHCSCGQPPDFAQCIMGNIVYSACKLDRWA